MGIFRIWAEAASPPIEVCGSRIWQGQFFIIYRRGDLFGRSDTMGTTHEMAYRDGDGFEFVRPEAFSQTTWGPELNEVAQEWHRLFQHNLTQVTRRAATLASNGLREMLRLDDWGVAADLCDDEGLPFFSAMLRGQQQPSPFDTQSGPQGVARRILYVLLASARLSQE